MPDATIGNNIPYHEYCHVSRFICHVSIERSLYQRGESFRFRRVADGERLMEVWGRIPTADAIRKAQRYNFEIEDGQNPVCKSKRESSTFTSFAAEWLAIKAMGLRRKSLVRYRTMVDHFGRFLSKSKGKHDLPLAAISVADASAYVQWRAVTPIMPNGQKELTAAVHQGAARKTIHEEANMLRQLFKAALRRGLLTANPFDEVRVQKPKRHEVAAKHHPLTEAEEAAFLKAAAEIDTERQYGNGGLHDIFLFFLKTGLRESELRYLEWSNVQWEQGLIRILLKDVSETRTVDIPSSAVHGWNG
jgi:integrase